MDFAVLADFERKILTRTFAPTMNIADLFDDDFVEFGRSGTVYTKPQILAALIEESECTEWVADLIELVTRPLSPNLALVTYVSFRRYDDGRTDRRSLRSSLWRSTDGQWRMIFYQGTPTV